MNRFRQLDERGSIPVFMAVMLILTALVLVTVEAVGSDLRSSRRSGDSANALQVADAGINDAIQQAPVIPKTTATFTRTGTLGNGTYVYTATRDPVRTSVWHIDSLGTDLTGVKRRVKAQAVPGSIFNNPLFVNASLTMKSGISLDSFASGTSHPQMCTKKGIIGTNDPTGMDFTTTGSGLGVTNCQKRLGIDPTWDYSMDGCTSYGDGTQDLPPIATGKCPPEPHTFRTPPRKFKPPAVFQPGTIPENPRAADFSGEELTCDLSKPATTDPTPTLAKRNVHSLAGDTVYYYTTSVVLRDGCKVTTPATVGGFTDPERPVFIYSAGDVKIGEPTGRGGTINEPPPSSSVCGATAASTLFDGASPKNPALYYCPLWSAGLRIRLLTGNTRSVEIRSNGTKFWGAIEAPSGSFELNGSDIEVWGAAVSHTGVSKSQFTWHFDEALSTISAGRYSSFAWREEAT